MHVVVGNDPVAVTGSVVTASYFTVLGITPYLGRFFTADEDAVRDRDAVVVVSYGFWANTLGADPQALGRSIDVNGRGFTIVGIAPRDFNGVVRGGSVSQLWIPSAMFAVGYRYCDALDPDCTIVEMIGRLKRSVTIQEAETGLAVLARQLDATYPRRNPNRPRSVTVLHANGAYPAVQTSNGPIVRLLLGGVGLLVLIACANVAGLMLAGGLSRRKEMAVKIALGASRARVMRQVLAECVLLAISGSVFGLALAAWAVDLVSAFYGADYAGRPVNFNVSLGAWPLAATTILCGSTAILCGMAPAIQAARTDVLPALKLEGVSGRRTRTRSRDVLVASQVAMSTVLLIGAGLLVRSTTDLMRGPGIDPDHVALLRLRPSLVGYDAERARTFQRAVIERLTAVPGVERAATSENLPVFFSGSEVTISSESSGGRIELTEVRASHVGDGYFDVMGLRLLSGRDFNSGDRPGTRRVAIANATLASALGGSDIVGRVITVDDEPHEIIGIVPGAHFRNALEPPAPYLYLNYWQQDGEGFAADSRTHVRVAGDPTAILPRLRREVAAIDRNVPVSEDYPLRDRVRFHFQPVRMAMTILVLFGVVALTLSVIGIYSVLSSIAMMRAREVAVRMALGARRQQIGWLMADHGLRLVIPGVIIGVLAALFSSAVLRSLLYGVAHHDIATFAAIPLVLVFIAFAAMSVPIRRTMRVDPAVTLRGE
jgi:predicted permease